MRWIMALMVFFVACSGGGRGAEVAPAASAGRLTFPVRFTAVYSQAAHTLTFQRALSSGITPAVATVIPEPTGIPDFDGSPPDGFVDLTSPNPCTGVDPIFCEVDLTWGGVSYTLIDPIVTITKAGIGNVDAAQTSSGDGINDDGTDNPYDMARSHGLWNYTTAPLNPGPSFSTDLRFSFGNYLSASGVCTNCNVGGRIWELNNADPTEDIQYEIAVYANTSYSSYVAATQAVTYVNACSGGTAVTTDQTGLSLPWDVTIYNSLFSGSGSPATTLNFSVAYTEVTFGTTGLDFGPGPSFLPNNAVVAPAVYPFAEFGGSGNGLVPGAGGACGLTGSTFTCANEVCYKFIGVAPARQLVIEWQGMDFADPPDQGSSMDFEILLSEGLGEMDITYAQMVNGNGMSVGRANGTSACVGVQNATATEFAPPGACGSSHHRTGVKVAIRPSP